MAGGDHGGDARKGDGAVLGNKGGGAMLGNKGGIEVIMGGGAIMGGGKKRGAAATTGGDATGLAVNGPTTVREATGANCEAGGSTASGATSGGATKRGGKKRGAGLGSAMTTHIMEYIATLCDEQQHMATCGHCNRPQHVPVVIKRTHRASHD